MTYNQIGILRGGKPLVGFYAADQVRHAAWMLLATALLASGSGCAAPSWFASNRRGDDDEVLKSAYARPGSAPSGTASNKTPIAAYAGVGNAQNSGAGSGPSGATAFPPSNPQSPIPNPSPGYGQSDNSAGAPNYAAGGVASYPPPTYAAASTAASQSQPYYAAPQQTNPSASGGASNGYQPFPASAATAPSATQPYYGSQPGPYATTARMVDPNVVPVSATDVAPPGPDSIPPVGLGGPAAGAPGYPAPQAPGPGQGQTGPVAPAVVVPDKIADSKDEDEGFDLSKLEPDYTWKQLKNMIGWGPDESFARGAYAAGQELYRAKAYDEAAEQFYTATWRWPDSLLEEDAMFLEAESYFFADRYGKAQDAYTELLKKHENTRYMDTAVKRLFDIATYWEQVDQQYHHWPLTPNATDRTTPIFDTYGNMLAAYRAVWLNDPTGPLADVAVMRVANSHFRRGEWEDAAYHYSLIRKNHPKSKYQKDAHVLELQSRMRLYQGPRYSASPLSEAEEVANQTLKQFPGQLGEEEARVRQTKAEIVELRAERDWMMAEYYESKAYYGAAKYYYRDILEHFPHTQFAQRTRQRMTEIAGLPDEPPSRFAWLTGLFERDR